MTLIELVGCLGSFAGLVLGAIFGTAAYGIWGGVLGAIIGPFAGLFIGILILAIPAGIGVLLERHSQRTRLRSRFGRYYLRKRSDFESLKQQLEIGQSLSGEVVAEFYYGVFIDVGLAFPAFLGKLQMADEDAVQMGANVEAHLVRFSNFERQIQLSQGDVEESLRVARLLNESTSKHHLRPNERFRFTTLCHPEEQCPITISA